MEEYLLASIISALLTNISNFALSERQAQRSENLMDKQNQYNMPAEQVKRLQQAGINPSALQMGYGMQVSGNTSAQPNQYQLASMLDPMSLASNAALSGAKANETNSLLEERRKNLAAETAKYEADIKLLGVNTLGQQIANDYAAALNEAAITKSYSEVGLNWFQCRQLKADVEKMQYELQNVLPQQLRESQQRVAESEQNVQESKSRVKLNTLEQDRIVALIANIKADTQLKGAETELAQAKTTTEGTTQNLQAASEENIVQQTQQSEAVTEEIRNQIQLFLDTYEDQIQIIANQRKLSTKQVRWFIANQILNGGKAAASGAAGVGAGIAAASRLAPAAGASLGTVTAPIFVP